MRRIVAIALAAAACATAASPVPDVAGCERACRGVRDHCEDDSAKQRQTGTTCDQDLRDCLNLCDAQAEGDPSERARASQRRAIETFIEGRQVPGLPGAPTR